MPSLSVLNILRTIKDRGTVSRTDLQQSTGLSWGTITNTTRDLLTRNLIREEGSSSTKAGRKPMRLAINPSSHGIIGIELGVAIVRCQVLNLAGESLGYEEAPFTLDEPPERVLDRICQMIQTGLDLPIMTGRTCLGIGFSVPGHLDASRGTLLSSKGLPRWNHVGLRQFIQDRVGLQPRIEHAPNCLALAERWFGEAGQADDVLCLSLGDTVGMGILAGGEVFRGSQQRAGEFGHMIVDPHGPPSARGDHGCVEAYASVGAVREYARSLAQKQTPELAALLQQGDPSLQQLAAAAKAGDAAARESFERAGKYLGIATANLINLFNPHLIVLAGVMTHGSDLFMGALRTELELHTCPQSHRRILISQLGEHAIATGACGIVLQSIFEPSQIGSSELQQV